jgi:uncharacterized coiled-coil protein SlyX
MSGAPWAVDADTLDGKHATAFAVSTHTHPDWHITGNAGTTSGTHFLGTTDMKPLDLRVNNARAFRIMPTGGAPNIIGGSISNYAPASVEGATIGGGQANTAGGTYATVSGGGENGASGLSSVVSGGFSNTASGGDSTVGGGYQNKAAGYRSTIAGGHTNETTATYSTVGGGQANKALNDYSAVAGGYRNLGVASNATVGGGWSNMASGISATVAGGDTNWANGPNAAIAGGRFNKANGGGAVGGGYDNTASGNYATIGGGAENTASDNFATVGGGHYNTASGSYSFAAGRRAKAANPGSFAWADSTNADFVVDSNDRFAVRASGGVYLYTNSTSSTGAYLAAGSGTWASVSDRNAKENFVSVDGGQVLEKIAAIPISTWNYKSEDRSIRHMGPMAQDLHAAFGLGDSDKSIATIDADGVALAAIQGLYGLLQEKVAEIASLKAEKDAQFAAQQQRIADLEAARAAQEVEIKTLNEKNTAVQARLAALESMMTRLSLSQMTGR